MRPCRRKTRIPGKVLRDVEGPAAGLRQRHIPETFQALFSHTGSGMTTGEGNAAPGLSLCRRPTHSVRVRREAIPRHLRLNTAESNTWHMDCMVNDTQRIGKYFPVGSKEGFYDYC